MEVHHPSHPTHKKKAKEYLIEFVMLFTAVTLGFFAENVREIYVEKERAHELVERFEKDVQINIAFIDSLLNQDNKMEYQMATALVGLTSAKEEYDLNIFFNNVFSSFPRFLSKNDTYEQMKSSGSLRYIKDKKLLDLMLDYSNEAEAAEYRSQAQESSYLLGTYADLLTSLTPPNIAIKKYLQSVETYKDRFHTPDSTLLQLKALDSLRMDTTYIIKGQQLEQFKKTVIPPMGRRLGLMKTTMRFLTSAKKKGEAVLEYLEKNH